MSGNIPPAFLAEFKYIPHLSMPSLHLAAYCRLLHIAAGI